ncbi:YdcF family protein [Oscillatoria sp. FACHB-1406]|uniref:YdcF family protein n=1 Tax=Oscillatoria sp. FACHB-1406 TaxID=2692846 RepID=UPI003220424F
MQASKSKRRIPLWAIPLVGIALFATYKELKSLLVKPQAIFVLGGEERREAYAAKFARQHPDLPIWVSSGSPEDYAKRLFGNRGIARDRVYLDYAARDTVTNFTTLVDRLKAQNIHSVYLITSDDHMLRARIVGEIVFGSRGITIKPIAVPSGREPEPVQKCVRDGARAVLWLTTGYTGATLKVRG